MKLEFVHFRISSPLFIGIMWNELGLKDAASRDLFNESAPLEADQNEGYAAMRSCFMASNSSKPELWNVVFLVGKVTSAKAGYAEMTKSGCQCE